MNIHISRVVTYAVILALVAFGLWPYMSIFHLDSALRQPDATTALTPYVNLTAVQAHYKKRLNNTVDTFVPTSQGHSQSDQVLNWVMSNVRQLGDSALQQAITLDWVRTTLNEAAEQATAERPASFMSAIDFAFFESWDRVVIRLGALDRRPTYVILSLQSRQWQVTDVIRSCW